MADASSGGAGGAIHLNLADADALVAGTAVFKGGPDRYASNIAQLRGG